jgi:hypothetical protein
MTSPRLRELAVAVIHPGLAPQRERNHDGILVVRLWLKMTVAMSGVALVLSLAGIFAVLSFAVTRRTRKSARVALASRPSDCGHFGGHCRWDSASGGHLDHPDRGGAREEHGVSGRRRTRGPHAMPWATALSCSASACSRIVPARRALGAADRRVADGMNRMALGSAGRLPQPANADVPAGPR